MKHGKEKKTKLSSRYAEEWNKDRKEASLSSRYVEEWNKD
jgi:hypothetical protein